MENKLFDRAEALLKKGYNHAEIREVLRELRKGRLDEKEIEVIDEALIGFDGD